MLRRFGSRRCHSRSRSASPSGTSMSFSVARQKGVSRRSLAR